MRSSPILLALAALISLVSSSSSPRSPLMYPSHGPYKKRNVQIIPDSFIVVFKDGLDATAIQAEEESVETSILRRRIKRYGHSGSGSGHGLKYKFSMGGFNGYHVMADEETIAEIAASDAVAYVERNAKVSIAGKLSQANSTFGLSRISHRARGASNYVFDPSDCAGTTAYVIDTGILLTHEQFQGRAIFGTNTISSTDPDNSDENGHGTHVAGIIGGKDFGVCKDITLVAVKCLDANGAGTYANVIAGIQWAVNDAQTKNTVSTSVINLSIAGPLSAAMNSAAAAAVSAGIVTSVAAGNENQLASLDSPASEPSVLTVGAIDSTDARGINDGTVGSNFGPSVDIFAPGWDVESAYIGDGNVGTAVLEGTSQAAPFVAGVAAAFIVKEGLVGPKQVEQCIKTRGTANDVSNAGEGSPNLILYNGSGY